MRDTKKNTIKDAFNAYDNKFNVSEEEFIEVIRTFNNLLMRATIETGFGFKLPHRLGTISVQKAKTRGSMIDFGHFNKTGEKKKHLNNHSDGFYAAFYWNTKPPHCQLTKKFMFKFYPCRYYKRYLSEAIKNRNTMNKYFDYE